MDGVDVDPVALAELGEALVERRHGAVDGGADQEFRIGCARRAADHIDHVALCRLEQRPEQAGAPDGTEKFEREAGAPRIAWEDGTGAGPPRARRVDGERGAPAP